MDSYYTISHNKPVGEYCYTLEIPINSVSNKYMLLYECDVIGGISVLLGKNIYSTFANAKVPKNSTFANAKVLVSFTNELPSPTVITVLLKSDGIFEIAEIRGNQLVEIDVTKLNLKS
uniref:Uncharacterized protein n=1 Tax=Marseillevirus LCMAC201 TaxID=2506605 RepID=A0A481YWB3_9VIRU|nr:MAG: hypothetical protein LCMAC201_04660 [Marseillevirus LCMAC201]